MIGKEPECTEAYNEDARDLPNNLELLGGIVADTMVDNATTLGIYRRSTNWE